MLNLEAKQAQLKKRLKYLKNEIKKLEIENNKLRDTFDGTQEQD